MDWEKLAYTWGPAAPFMVILFKLLWDLVYKIIPRGFRSLHRCIHTQAQKSSRRHKEHMALMRALHQDLMNVKLARGDKADHAPPRRRKRT